MPKRSQGPDAMVKRPALKSGPVARFNVRDQILASTDSPSDILPNPTLYQDLSMVERYKYIHAGRLAQNWVVNFGAES